MTGTTDKLTMGTLHAQQEPVHVTERWLSHMMPITMKLTTLAANEDHRSQS
jgi:hypothetical protein